jgi:hypothetical protein
MQRGDAVMRWSLILALDLLAVLNAHPAWSQWVYFGSSPGACYIPHVFHNPTVFVYVHAPDVDDPTGITFQVDTDAFGPEDIVSLTPMSGVSTVEGDLFNGMTLSWSPREMEHEAVLQLYLEPQPPDTWDDTVWTRNATLYSSITGPQPLEDVLSIVNIIWDCHGPGARWRSSDTASVVTGKLTTFEIEGIVQCLQLGYGAGVEIIDTQGWVVSWDPAGLAGGMGCPWHWQRISIGVDVPAETPDGTLNTITVRAVEIQPMPFECSIVLRGEEPVSVRESTLGRIKALYREGEP